MAAYGRVVVVTINYRLGVLGTVVTQSRAVELGIIVGYGSGVLSLDPDPSEHSVGIFRIQFLVLWLESDFFF